MILQGINPDRVDDKALFKLGQKGTPDGRAEYQYMEASGAITASFWIITGVDGQAAMITATLAAAASGARVALAPATPSQSIVDGKFFWGCICAPVEAGLSGQQEANNAAGAPLYAEATPGTLSDTNDNDTYIAGVRNLVVVAGADALSPVEISYPYVHDGTQV